MYLRRLPERMVAYWEQLKKDAPLPKYENFRSDVISDLWDHCTALSLFRQGGINNYTYEYVGREIINAYGKNPAGSTVNSHLKGEPGDKIIARLDDAAQNLQPVIENGVFINKNGKSIKYRACILPFGTDNHANHMVVGIAWQPVT